MDTLRKLFADESISQPLRQKVLDLIGDLSSGSLQQEPVGTGCALLHSGILRDWLHVADILAGSNRLGRRQGRRASST